MTLADVGRSGAVKNFWRSAACSCPSACPGSGSVPLVVIAWRALPMRLTRTSSAACLNCDSTLSAFRAPFAGLSAASAASSSRSAKLPARRWVRRRLACLVALAPSARGVHSMYGSMKSIASDAQSACGDMTPFKTSTNTAAVSFNTHLKLHLVFSFVSLMASR